MIHVRSDLEYGGANVTIKGSEEELKEEFNSFLHAVCSDSHLRNIFFTLFLKIIKRED